MSLQPILRRARTRHAPGTHWSDFCVRRRSVTRARRDLGLVEFCQHCETVELWFDPDPNDQLQLVWLLDHFSSHPEIVARLRLRIVDFDLIMPTPEELGRLKVWASKSPGMSSRRQALTWQAYRAPTPEPCFDLLGRDLSALPLLRPALFDLLEELPSRATGLGATEMRLLELIARGYERTNALFHLRGLRRRRVFNAWEIGSLLEGLAHGPTTGRRGPRRRAAHTRDERTNGDRDEAYKRSRLSLTEFGKAIVAHQEDFSRHNPIDRWWGGTRLTNDRLWRWDPVLIAPLLPCFRRVSLQSTHSRFQFARPD